MGTLPAYLGAGKGRGGLSGGAAEDGVDAHAAVAGADADEVGVPRAPPHLTPPSPVHIRWISPTGEGTEVGGPPCTKWELPDPLARIGVPQVDLHVLARTDEKVRIGGAPVAFRSSERGDSGSEG